MTINTEVLEGNWNEIKGKLREKWGQISMDDLQRARGNVEQLVGVIERKTGEARQQVEQYLAELTAGGAKGLGRALDTAKQYAGQALESADDMASSAADYMREGYEQTERMVRNRPLESLAACFGAGIITGVVIGLMLKSK